MAIRADLAQDLATIQSIIGTDAIMIGEIMTASPGEAPQTFISSLQTAMNAGIAWGVPYMIYYQLYSALTCPVCGVLDPSGNITQLGQFLEGYLAGAQTCPADAALSKPRSSGPVHRAPMSAGDSSGWLGRSR